MPIFGSKQIEELTTENERLRLLVQQTRSQLASSEQRIGEALTTVDRLTKAQTATQASLTTARQSLAAFETSLKRTMQRLGGLLYVGENHWLDPQSVSEIKIQSALNNWTLEINGQPLESGSQEDMMALAHAILDARQQATK